VNICKEHFAVTAYVLFHYYTVSADDKDQSPSVSSGSQQTPLNSSSSSALSYNDKPQSKEPTSKSGRRFNYGSSGRQYQVFVGFVVCEVV